MALLANYRNPCHRLARCVASAAVLLLVACNSDSTNTDNVSDSQSNQEVSLVESVTTSPVDVMSEFVQRSVEVPPIAPANQNLLVNGGFEDELTGWTLCASGQFSATGNAYEGSYALEVGAGTCVYQSVQVEPGQELVLSCYAKGVEQLEWTGMGLGFSDESWNTLFETGATLVSGTSYSRYDVSATAPSLAKYVSMWFYTETEALLDQCVLHSADIVVTPPVSEDINLLDNPDFNLTTNAQADNWQVFCGGGSKVVDLDGEQTLQVYDGACVSQSLSASDIAQMRGRLYELSCEVSYDYNPGPGGSSYSSIGVTIDGEEILTKVYAQRRYGPTLTVLAPENATSGYVTIYSEDGEGAFNVSNCSLLPKEAGLGQGYTDPASNLIINGGFDIVDSETNLPSGWKVCGVANAGAYTSIQSPSSDAAIELLDVNGGGAPCIERLLSPDAVDALRYNDFTLYCDAWNFGSQASGTIGSNWISLKYPDNRSLYNSDVIELSPSAYYQPMTLSGQFEELSSVIFQLRGPHVRVDNCYLKAGGDGNRSLIDVRANLEGSDSYQVNGPFTFDVTVTNNGKQYLDNIEYSTEGIDCDGMLQSLSPNETVTFQCTNPLVLTGLGAEETMHVYVSGTDENGETVVDKDVVAYSYNNFATKSIWLTLRANDTALPGENGSVRVSIMVNGKGASLDAVDSNFPDCAKTYDPPLVTGQYDVFDCTIPSILKDTRVNVKLRGTSDREETVVVRVFDQ